MTQQEVAKILSVAEGAYPEKTAFWNDATKLNLLKSWYMVLADYTYEEGSIAMRVYLRNDKYNRFPGVGQLTGIIDELAQSTKTDDLTASAAWNIVRPAIRDGIYHSNEHFAEFPKIIQVALGGPERLKEWAQLPSDTIDSVIRSDFCNRMYPVAVKRRQEHDRLPVDIRVMIEKKRAENGEIEANIKAIEEKPEENSTTSQKHDADDHSEQISNLEKSLFPDYGIAQGGLRSAT